MKDLFTLNLGVGLWLASKGVTGWFADIAIQPFVVWILGDLLDVGIFAIDIILDKVKDKISSDKYKELALKAHQKATAKIYTEEEKVAIRKQYLDALSVIATFGVVHNDPKH